MDYILSQIVNGLCQGAIYALIAIGYSVVAGVTGMVTFTHGEVMMIGALASFEVFMCAGNNLLLGILAGFAASWLLGILVYKLCYERFFDAPPYISLLCTIGFSMLVKNIVQAVVGSDKKPILEIMEIHNFHIGPVRISNLQLIIVLVVIVLAVGLSLIFKKTRWGIALRAVSKNKKAANLVGINVKQTAMLGNCIGCGLGGVAGVLLAVYYQTFYATMGGSISLKAFTSSLLGGLTDMRFSALGGLCIGMAENIGIAFSSSNYRDIFAFVFLLLVLMIRPQGFAKSRKEKV